MTAVELYVTPADLEAAAAAFVNALGSVNAYWLLENLQNVESNSDAMRALKAALIGRPSVPT